MQRRMFRGATVTIAASAAVVVGTVVAATNSSAAGAGPLRPAPTSGVTQTSSHTVDKSITGRLAQNDPAVLKLTGSKPVTVMVKLDYDALSSYQGNIHGYAATSPHVTGHKLDVKSAAAQKYLGYVHGVENKFRSALSTSVPAATVASTYTNVYGGAAVRLPANKVSKLLSLPGVAAVQADTLHQLDAATPVNDDDASFIGANSAYSALGSSATAGKGVLIADIDTGVWPEHPSFANRSDLTAPPATADGHARACNFGTNPLTGVPFTCNDKLIEGQAFLNTYNSLNDDELYPDTARDSNGHGTHTTSTAGGNPVAHATLFGVDRGPIQGIAPGAWLMSYKALGPKGGYDSDLVAAIQAAVADGADVINYSIGPSTPQSAYSSADDLAFLDAFDAGVFVSASAGNSGPGTASHLGPWETTVGATTLQRAFVSTATVHSTDGASLSISGSSIMPGISSPAPVVLASAAPYSDQYCGTPAPAGTFTGKIVVCVRGGTHAGAAIGRVQKGYDVLQGGAAGMFLVNPTVQDTETDNHFLPAVHFDAPAGNQLTAFLAAHPGVTATFTAGQKANGQGDVMAAFSSTGPGGDFLKPDIAAPGVQILAGNTPTPTDVASGPQGQLYQAIAGTSMAAPHITGSAALVLALHPTWTPAEVKSALMMTANTNVVKPDGSTPATPLDDGAGRVNLAGIVATPLVLNVTPAQMDSVLTDPLHRIDLNEPSVYDASLPGRVTTTRTFTNPTTKSEAFNLSVTSDLAGSVTVTPTTIALKPGVSKTVQITLDGSNGTVGQWYKGSINLKQTVGGTGLLHLPVLFSPSDASSSPLVTVTTSCTPSVIALRALTDCTSHVVNNGFTDATVSATVTGSSALKLNTNNPYATTRTKKFGPVTLAAATAPKPHAAVTPGGSPAGGYLDLSGFGIARTSIGDEEVKNFSTGPFVYDGRTYTSIGVVSDGYIVVGGGDDNDVTATPSIPNPAKPNNVLAPFWADLDGGSGTLAGQGIMVGVLGDGTNNWLVVQWNVHPWSGSATDVESFQAWIGLNGTQDISYTYGSISDPSSTFAVGAEDVTGQFGNTIAGLPSDDVVVTSSAAVPGGEATFATQWRGIARGPATVETDVTSSVSRDSEVSRARVTVV